MAICLPGGIEREDVIGLFGALLILMYLLSTQALALIDPNDPIAQVAVVSGLLFLFGEHTLRALKRQVSE